MKGISPLIATVMLVAITVAMVSIYAGWYTSLLGGQTNTVTNKTKIAVDCTSARLSVLDVYLDTTNNMSRVNVRNSGQVDDNIVSVFVYNSLGINATNMSAVPVTINMGTTLSFEFNTSGVIPACGNFSSAVVTSECKREIFTSTPKGC